MANHPNRSKAGRFFIYEIVYAGNGYKALMNATVYLSKQEAEAAVSVMDGFGLRYGAEVRTVEITRVDIDRHDRIKGQMQALGYAPNLVPHMEAARAALQQDPSLTRG